MLRAHYKLTKAAAFDGLPLTPELLRGALTYHVVPGAAALAADLTNGQLLPTLNTDAPPLEVGRRGAVGGGGGGGLYDRACGIQGQRFFQNV